MIPVEIRGVAERHLADDELVRRIDDELDPAEVDRVEAHLAGCDRCRATLAELSKLSARFSAVLPLADHVPHAPADRAPAVALRTSPAWIASPVWRAAAAIAFLAGLALAISPVRAWMAERLGLATRPVEETPAVLEPRGNDSPDNGLRIAFVPEGDRFIVRVSQPQATGSLTLSAGAGAGDSASAEIAGEGASIAADLLVLPDGLGIRNDASSTADYRVTVPGGLTRVEVRVADRLAWTGSPQLLAEGARTIPLR